MKRFALVVPLALVLGLVMSTEALASGPVITPSPVFEGVIAAGLICPFAFRVTTITNNEIAKSFYDANGDLERVLITGFLSQSFKNLSTGKKISLIINGPVVLYNFGADGTYSATAPGPQFVGLFPTDEGGPGLFQYFGRVTYDRLADGTIVNLQSTGRVVDLCAAMS
jgi:hypothetical protein